MMDRKERRDRAGKLCITTDGPHLQKKTNIYKATNIYVVGFHDRTP